MNTADIEMIAFFAGQFGHSSLPPEERAAREEAYQVLGATAYTAISEADTPFRQIDTIHEQIADIVAADPERFSGDAAAKIRVLLQLRESTRQSNAFICDGKEAWAFMNGQKSARAGARQRMLDAGYSEEEVTRVLG